MKLRETSAHARLVSQYTDKEMKIIEMRFNELCEQFGNNLLATEIDQIVDYIKMSHASEQLQAQIKELREQREELMKRDTAPAKKVRREVSAMIDALTTRSQDYMDNSHSILKQLKATREQRLKNNETSGADLFKNFLYDLYTSEEKRDEMGREMEMMRMAMERERDRLSAYHEFEDGEVDRPFLNCDVVMENDE